MLPINHLWRNTMSRLLLFSGETFSPPSFRIPTASGISRDFVSMTLSSPQHVPFSSLSIPHATRDRFFLLTLYSLSLRCLSILYSFDCLCLAPYIRFTYVLWYCCCFACSRFNSSSVIVSLFSFVFLRLVSRPILWYRFRSSSRRRFILLSYFSGSSSFIFSKRFFSDA